MLDGGLVAVDALQMRRAGPGRPRVRGLITDRLLRYSANDPHEEWQTYDELVEKIGRHGFAYADCEDLATLVAAEYRVDGVDPGARIHVYRTAPSVSHVVVRRSSGALEDPSRSAGMGWDEPPRQGPQWTGWVP